MSVKGYVSAYYDVPARGVLRSKGEENNPAYNSMSAEFTFLGPFQPKFVVFVG
jgi:hypothetical protein